MSLVKHFVYASWNITWFFCLFPLLSNAEMFLVGSDDMVLSYELKACNEHGLWTSVKFWEMRCMLVHIKFFIWAIINHHSTFYSHCTFSNFTPLQSLVPHLFNHLLSKQPSCWFNRYYHPRLLQGHTHLSPNPSPLELQILNCLILLHSNELLGKCQLL